MVLGELRPATVTTIFSRRNVMALMKYLRALDSMGGP